MALLRFGSDPFDNILRLQSALSRSLEHPLMGLGWTPSARGVFPPLNHFESEEGDAIVAVAEMPGIERDTLQIETIGNRLTLGGERTISSPEGEVRFHRKERRAGEFRRAFRLPYEVDPERSTATYRDGILTIRLEKAESAKPRHIKVATDKKKR